MRRRLNATPWPIFHNNFDNPLFENVQHCHNSLSICAVIQNGNLSIEISEQRWLFHFTPVFLMKGASDSQWIKTKQADCIGAHKSRFDELFRRKNEAVQKYLEKFLVELFT